MKDELRTDGDPIAWRLWSTAQNQLWQLRQPAPLLEFPGEQGMFTDMYAQRRCLLWDGWGERPPFKSGAYHWMSGTQESTPCPLCGVMSMLGASNLRRVAGYDFHHLRKKYDVPSMWGNIHPQWRLLQQHLEPKGLVGTRSLREKSGFLPTGLIGLEMI